MANRSEKAKRWGWQKVTRMATGWPMGNGMVMRWVTRTDWEKLTANQMATGWPTATQKGWR